MAINIKSFNQILGDMVRKIIADTPVNDINAGSILLTLLEAAASSDFENNTAILNVLELLNIDAVKNNDLDARAADYGLTRLTASKSSGLIKILNTNITKRSTGLYVIKPAPIAGQTTIYVNNTTDWAPTGSLYIGRGTQSFEGPIAYSAITVFPTYSAITLASALQKDHLISDTVIDSQGEPDRFVAAGIVVKIPANNQNPEVKYVTLRNAVIPSGEDSVEDVEVTAIVAGSNGNARINTVTEFETEPFNGAAVTNTSSFSNGRDIETDSELRNRIKSYAITLARGTAPSIISAVIGLFDADDSKQVASAVLTEPVELGTPSIMYIDDGSGFQPSFAGQPVDILLNNANGTEEFLQLANYPLPRPQVVNTDVGPYNLNPGSSLRVIVDGIEETIEFNESQFVNIASATLAEVITAINSNSTLFKARFHDNSNLMLLYPVAHDAEIIQVTPLQVTDDATLYANTQLKFPTNEFSYISLYQNSIRLHEKVRNAELATNIFSSWNITSSGNIIISVDGTPSQDRTFNLSDFPGATSFATLTLQDWVDAFNLKFAGLTAEATPSQTMKIVSNREGSGSSIAIDGGTYLNKWFVGADLEAEGQSAQFELNRQTGNIRILTDIGVGDVISAGAEDTKGFVTSVATVSGTYNVSDDTSGRPSEMVIVADSSFCVRRSIPLVIGGLISITNPSGTTMRIMSNSTDTFASLRPGDYIYIVKRSSSWLNDDNTGLFKIKAKGDHTTANTDSFVDVDNIDVVPEASIAVADSLDIKAFYTDGYPQIWRGSYVGNPPAEPISGVVDSINNGLLNVLATIFKSNSIKITSTTETDGSIAIPVIVGNAAQIFTETDTEQAGNPAHVANRVSSKSLISYFKRNPTIADTWLDRHVYADVKGQLTDDSNPDPAPFSGTYSEIVEASSILNDSNVGYEDYLSFTKGNNDNQFRSVKAFIATDKVGTQQGTARTELDHITGNEFQILKPVELSSEDSMVVIMDDDQTAKSVDIKMARTGQVNSGSGGAFIPTTTEFSANDYDNEPGIDFSSAPVWGTSTNKTDFSDYAVWFRARNWYAAGGLSSGLGQMLVRSAQYGPNGEKMRFSIQYPTLPLQDPATTFLNTPSYNLLTFFFASGLARPIAVSALDTITVSGPYPDDSTNFPAGAPSSGDYYDYQFSAGNFTTVAIGDILSLNPGSGVSAPNSGQFRVANKSGLTLRVFNPNASLSVAGSPEVVTVTTIADVVGTPTVYTIDTVADVAGSLHQKYFKIADSQGSVAVWFDVNNTGVSPPPHGANRAIKVATIVTGDSAVTVANKIAAIVALDVAYTVGVISNQITITNTINGNFTAATADTSGFTVATSAGTADTSVNGTYFTIYDDAGSVAVWYDVDNQGTPEPFHGADRSIRVGGVSAGDSAATVAAATVAAINPDSQFSASNLSNVITITNAFDGNVPAPSAGTSGFTVGSTDGAGPLNETISNTNLLSIFPLVGNDVATIVDFVNESDLIELTAVGDDSLLIEKATHEEDYSYGGNSTALAYGHNPTVPSTRGYITLHDSENWVKSFQNSNPNFTMKTTFILNGVAPSIYSMDTAPNYGISDLGELFKLIPVTVKNVYHHLTQKALSQLPIVADIRISSDRKNVQINSKNLGSSGAIEIIGGNANKAQSYILGESEIDSDIAGNFLVTKISAYPDTFNIGDTIRLENDVGVKRLSRLLASDTITVTNPSSGIIEYNYNPKSAGITTSTAFTITDVSASYSRPAGYVWRWTHDGSATLTSVIAGDMVYAFGPTLSWDQGNKVRLAGDGFISGLPIIAVNDALDYFDVVNPYGKAMASTAPGVGNTVQICPTPIIKWNLSHAARIEITSIVRSSNVITVTCSGQHYLNSGDSVNIIDSDNIIDADYSPVTVTSATTFTFASVGSNFTELNSGASMLKTGLVETRYRLENLNFNNMIRLSRYDGASPRFADCGVAVDDYIVISGDTFNSNNSGRFRVLAVDNDSLLLINSIATNDLNTIKKFNNKDLSATWTSNTNTITGLAGTFKYVSVGDWIKKEEDGDDAYVQVIAMSPSTPSLTTTVTLGSNYSGTTAIAPGVTYDMLNDYDKGVILKHTDDIAIYEGDSVVAGDTLSIQNIIDSNWFSVNNIGTFDIVEIGTNATTYKPFLRVNNSSGLAETNRDLSVSLSGFYITESLINKFYSIRQIYNIAIDDVNEERRAVYLTPHSRSYKFSNANNTSISHLGKLGYDTNIVTGIDGYLYYTGLLRRAQRIVDGYEPDPDNFPGRRAVGSAIEILPPLSRRIVVAVDITTDEGVSIGDISNNIKSVIINYIESLGVGEDVILSEIIAAVMEIRGVAAITFTNPTPNTERIVIADNEKAIISPNDIGVA